MTSSGYICFYTLEHSLTEPQTLFSQAELHDMMKSKLILKYEKTVECPFNYKQKNVIRETNPDWPVFFPQY